MEAVKLVAGLLSRRFGFDGRSLHVGSVVDEVAAVQV